MATITITIPDAQLQRVVDALCARPTIVNMPQPPIVPATGAAAKQVLIEWVKSNVVAHEVRIAQDAVVPPDPTGLVT